MSENSEKAEKEESSGKGCCSFFSCCGGCAIGALLTVLASFALVFGLYYYLPSYLEQRSAHSSDVLSKKTEVDETKLETFDQKLKTLSNEVAKGEPLDLTVTFSELELNSWIAHNLLTDEATLPLENAIVILDQGRAKVYLRARGKDLAKIMPAEQETAYIRDLLKKTAIVDIAAAASLQVQDGEVDLAVENVQIGPLPIPLFMANDLCERYIKERGGLKINELEVRDLKIEDESITLHFKGALR